ncbi:unnamed protein product [Closterium sp. NIES-53]
MAAQELRWLTYLLTDLGEQPRSPPVLYVDNKAMLALCQEHRLEHRTKHIALRYFLARELQQRGQLRLAYVASEANTADIFTKALAPGDHQRFCTMLACFALLDWSCDLLVSPTLPMGFLLPSLVSWFFTFFFLLPPPPMVPLAFSPHFVLALALSCLCSDPSCPLLWRIAAILEHIMGPEGLAFSFSVRILTTLVTWSATRLPFPSSRTITLDCFTSFTVHRC